MSSATVRTAARGLASMAGWPGALPFRETIDDAPALAGLPSTWFTLTFQGDSDDAVGIGAAPEYRETGRVILSVMAESGSGDSTAIGLADQVPALVRSHFKSNQIAVRGMTPAQMIEDGQDSEYSRYDVVVDYSRDHD